MPRFFALLILTLSGFSVRAQVQQIRFEVETSSRHSDFAVFDAGSNGLILLRQLKSDRTTGDQRIQLNILDPLLNIRTVDTLSLLPSMELQTVTSDDDLSYLVFKQREMDIPQFEIIRIEHSGLRILPYRIRNELPFDFTEAIAIDNQLILSGLVRGVPSVLSFTEGIQTFKLLPGISLSGEVLSLSGNNDGKTFNLITLERNGGNAFVHLTTYGNNSIVFRKTVKMKSEAVTAKSLGFIDGNILLVGTYGSRQKNYTQGIFITRIGPDEAETEVRYHDISAFDHFFDYADERDRERLSQKVERRSTSGNEAKFNKVLFIRDLQNFGKQVVMNLEMYQITPAIVPGRSIPRNSYESRTSFRINPYNDYNRNIFRFAINPEKYLLYKKLFLGFENDVPGDNTGVALEQLQSWTVGLNYDGSVGWDNSMPVMESDRLRDFPLTAAAITSDGLIYVHAMEENIIYSENKFEAARAEEYLVPYLMEKDSDKLVSVSENPGSALHSGNRRFYVWGSQRIKGESKRRDVIYINGIFFPENN